MNAYFSVAGETGTEKIIEKSRFLSFAAHTESEEAAKAYLAKLRSLHPLATHICYGYVADRIGNLQRFSDDGEPQGTAGMPILGVIKAKELVETTVAVVRYFGGIKLGAGGLTRAYASGASEVIAAAKICRFELCAELLLAVSYSDVNPLTRFLADYEVLGREFSEEATFRVIVPAEQEEAFRKKVNDCLNGRVRISEIKRYFHGI